MNYEPLYVVLIENCLDDEQIALRALRTTDLPLLVRVFRDGEEAVHCLGLDGKPHPRPCPAPDLVISDLKMPKVNGDEVLRQIRADERLHDVPFVVYTSSDEPSDRDLCLESGATAFLSKPVPFDAFVERTGAIVREAYAAPGMRHTLPDGGGRFGGRTVH